MDEAYEQWVKTSGLSFDSREVFKAGWEAHEKTMPRKMYEVGAEGDKYRPHYETRYCASCGCVPV